MTTTAETRTLIDTYGLRGIIPKEIAEIMYSLCQTIDTLQSELNSKILDLKRIQ